MSKLKREMLSAPVLGRVGPVGVLAPDAAALMTGNGLLIDGGRTAG